MSLMSTNESSGSFCYACVGSYRVVPYSFGVVPFVYRALGARSQVQGLAPEEHRDADNLRIPLAAGEQGVGHPEGRREEDGRGEITTETLLVS